MPFRLCVLVIPRNFSMAGIPRTLVIPGIPVFLPFLAFLYSCHSLFRLATVRTQVTSKTEEVQEVRERAERQGSQKKQENMTPHRELLGIAAFATLAMFLFATFVLTL